MASMMPDLPMAIPVFSVFAGSQLQLLTRTELSSFVCRFILSTLLNYYAHPVDEVKFMFYFYLDLALQRCVP